MSRKQFLQPSCKSDFLYQESGIHGFCASLKKWVSVSWTEKHRITKEKKEEKKNCQRKQTLSLLVVLSLGSCGVINVWDLLSTLYFGQSMN